jgi:hypothetical protein
VDSESCASSEKARVGACVYTVEQEMNETKNKEYLEWVRKNFPDIELQIALLWGEREALQKRLLEIEGELVQYAPRERKNA